MMNKFRKHPDMLSVEGYIMFVGELVITPVVTSLPAFTVRGTFLYKPDTNCWYGGGRSFPADICEPYPYKMNLEEN